MIGRTNSGGSSKIHIQNYATAVNLPVVGYRNQIGLINSTAINKVYLQPTAPGSPTEGDVWFKTGWAGNVYLQIDSLKVHLTTCRQYVSEAWTIIPEWYVYMNTWTRTRLYLIQDGVITGAQSFSTVKWKRDSGNTTPGGSTTFTQNNDNVYIYHSNTTTDAGVYVGAGIRTANFNAGQYSRLYVDCTNGGSGGYNDSPRFVTISPSGGAYASLNAALNQTFSSSTGSTITTKSHYTITQTDTPCCIYFGLGMRNNGNNAWMRLYNVYLE